MRLHVAHGRGRGAIALTTTVIHRRLRLPAGGSPADDEPTDRTRVRARAQRRGRFVPSSGDGYTLLVSLRGSLNIDSIDGLFRLHSRHFLCLPDTSLRRITAGARSDWMSLHLPRACLAEFACCVSHPAIAPPFLLPASLPLGRPMMRAVASLLRAYASREASNEGAEAITVLAAAIHRQLDSLDWVQRAYGRSERHRRAVVVRLLSARNRIINAPFMAHDLASLAAAARYSPSHFLRSFREVFGMTPRELVTESRMAMARELIQSSDLAIHEIATNVGYESSHAFSRLFKREHGATASDFRNGRCARRD